MFAVCFAYKVLKKVRFYPCVSVFAIEGLLVEVISHLNVFIKLLYWYSRVFHQTWMKTEDTTVEV